MTAAAGHSLRGRVRRAIAGTVAVALLLLGVPLAVVLARLIDSQALAGLQRDATRAVAAVPDNLLQAGAPLALPRSRSGVDLAAYDPGGVRVAGRGPERSALAARAADGAEHDGADGSDLAVVVPVLSDGAVAGSLRAAVPGRALRHRVARAWALLLGLAAVVGALALLLAERAARRISRPFEALTAAARGLGEGRYELDLPTWGLAEADAAASALRDSARSVDQLVRHERDFVRHASHQLRTPLSGVLLRLEQEPPDVQGAIARALDLQTTIADLLSLRAVGGAGSCCPAEVAREVTERRDSPARRVVLRADDTPDVGLSAAGLRQALDVLVDNALRHGRGEVTVTVEPYGDQVVVEVSDSGPGLRAGWRAGTGLHLATGIVERAGGSLLVREQGRHPRLALLLPQPRTDAPGADVSGSGEKR